MPLRFAHHRDTQAWSTQGFDEAFHKVNTRLLNSIWGPDLECRIYMVQMAFDLAPHQGKIKFTPFVLLFTGFFLFLLTNLGVPIAKNIYLMIEFLARYLEHIYKAAIGLTSSMNKSPPHILKVRFGVWGVCTTG
jgi:hypothetical protein